MTLQRAGGLHLTPDVFAVVMATGILSVAAGDHRYPPIDGVLAALAALVFVLLGLIGLVRLVAAPIALLRKARDLATHTRWRGWVVLSTAGLVLSVLLYLVTAWLIGRRVVTTPIAANDVTPDTWILMGALTINALASVRLRSALRSQAVWTWFADAMHPAILVLWVGASAWIPVLLSAEIWRLYRRPDSVHFAGVW